MRERGRPLGLGSNESGESDMDGSLISNDAIWLSHPFSALSHSFEMDKLSFLAVAVAEERVLVSEMVRLVSGRSFGPSRLLETSGGCGDDDLTFVGDELTSRVLCHCSASPTLMLLRRRPPSALELALIRATTSEGRLEGDTL